MLGIIHPAARVSSLRYNHYAYGAIAGGVAAVASAGVGIMGAMGGSSGGSSSSQQQSAQTNLTPWQTGYVQQGMSNAPGLYQQQQAMGPYTGDYYAPGNQTQQNAVNYGGGYMSGMGSQLSNASGQAALGLYNAAAPYLQNAEGLAGGINYNPTYTNTINQAASGNLQAGGNAQLASSQNAAALQASEGLSGFQNTLSQAAQQGLANPTAQVEANAQTYANSPQTQANLAATNQAISNTFNQQVLPQVNRTEAASGNLNSSRAGMQYAEAQSQEAQQIGSADAAIQNNAYNTGMNTASSLYQSGLNSAVAAGTAGYNSLAGNQNTVAGQQIGQSEYNVGNQLGAANSGINSQVENQNAMLSGNSQLGAALGYGTALGNSSVGQAVQNYGLGAAAGNEQQQYIDQPGLNNQIAQYASPYGTYQQGYNALQNYMGIVGQSYGSNGTVNQQSQQALPPQESAAGIGSTLTNGVQQLYNGYNNNFGSNTLYANANDVINQGGIGGGLY